MSISQKIYLNFSRFFADSLEDYIYLFFNLALDIGKRVVYTSAYAIRFSLTFLALCAGASVGLAIQDSAASGIPEMTTWTVSSPAELQSALNSATGGDQIVLESGNYGNVTISGKNFATDITITSIDEGDPAVFGRLTIKSSSGLTFDGIEVFNPASDAAHAPLVEISRGSHDITIKNSEVHGPADGRSYRGIDAKEGTYDITVEDNYIHHVKTGGVFIGADDVNVSGNTFNYIGSDAMKFGKNDGVVIENNTGPTHLLATAYDHADFIQFQSGSSTNIVIRGNVLLTEETGVSNQQAIFLGDYSVSNALIENNLIYTNSVHGILVSGTNITVINNTILNSQDDSSGSHKVTRIFVNATDRNSIVENNITDSIDGNNNASNNIVGPSNYNGLYVNGDVGPGATTRDFIPVAGSAAETMGAHELIATLTGSGPPIDPQRDPDAADDSVTLDEDGAATFNVLGNDSDPNGDTLTISGFSDPDHGSVVHIGDGAFTYTPEAGYHGTDSFTYTVTDGNGGRDTATVTLTVNAADNDAPIAADDSVVVGTDTPAVIDVLANDSDPDNDTLSVDSFTQPSNGTVTYNGDGTFTFVADAGYIGTDSFTYTVTDGNGGTATATAVVTVTQEDSSGRLPLIEEGPITLTGAAGRAPVMAHKTAYELASGTMAFTFTADSVGGRKFLFSKDSSGFDDGGHMGVYIENGAVVVRIQSETDTYTARTTNLIKPGEAHHVAVTFGASNGLTVFVDGVAAATSDYSGGLINNAEPIVLGANQWASGNGRADSLIDGFDGTLTGFTLYGSVMDAAEVAALSDAALDVTRNSAPVGVDDAYTVETGSVLSIGGSGVLANDSDVDGDALSASVVSGPSNGSLTLNSDGSFTYTPNSGFTGTDSYTYAVADGLGGVDTATAVVTVTPSENGIPQPVVEGGPYTFTGAPSGARVISHNTAYELESGTLAFTFTADSVKGQKFLLSKDSAGFDDGGHLGVYIQNGTIVVRIQSETETYTARTARLIEPGEAHHVAVTFGAADGLTVFVDGAAAATNSYSGGLIANTEPIVLGANQWSSGNGVADSLTNAFDGTLTEFALYDAVLEEDAVAAMADEALFVPPVLVEEDGNSSLMVADEQYVITTGDGVMVGLTYQNGAVGPKRFDGWEAIQAEESADGGFEVLWQNVGGSYALWSVDQTGNHTGTEFLTKAGLVQYAGAYLAEVEAEGDASLLIAGQQYLITAGDGVIVGLTYQNSVVGPERFDGWDAIQAEESSDGGFEVLWQNVGGSYALWSVDEDGRHTDTEFLTETDLVRYEGVFQADLNGDGTVNPSGDYLLS